MTIGSSGTYYNLLSNNIGTLLGGPASSSSSSLADLLGGIGKSSGSYGVSSKASAEDSKTATEIGSLKSAASDLTGSLKKLQDGNFKDTEDAVSKLKGFADSYNKLFDTAKSIAGEDGNAKLATQMVNASKTYAGALEKLGISFDEEGKMAIDSGKAAEAAGSGALGNFFSEGKGLSYGFSNQIGKIASNVTRNAQTYANATQAASNVGYNSSGNALSNLFASSGSLLNLLL